MNHSHTPLNMTYNIINLPCSIGQPHKGVAISKSQVSALFTNNHDIEHIPSSWFSEKPSKVILKCIESQRKYDRTIFFGGDHYASFFTVLSSLAVYGDSFRLIWLDAHGDIHNMRTSPSGNRHGMPVRFLMEHTLPGIPRLKPNQLMYIGLRDLERQEWAYIHRRKIRYMCAGEIKWQAIEKFVDGHIVHISLDVDVLDPSIMQCTGTPVPGGLSMEDLYKLYRCIDEKCRDIVTIDIMEYNPTLGDQEDKKTAKRTMKQICKMVT